MQSVEAIKISYAQALLVDVKALEAARQKNDVTQAQEILQEAYRTDVRPLVAEARLVNFLQTLKSVLKRFPKI